MPALVLRSGRVDRPYMEAARIELLGQPADRAALPGRIPACEDDNGAPLLVKICLLDEQHLELQLLQTLLERIAVFRKLLAFEILEPDLLCHGLSVVQMARRAAAGRDGFQRRRLGATALPRVRTAGMKVTARRRRQRRRDLALDRFEPPPARVEPRHSG